MSDTTETTETSEWHSNYMYKRGYKDGLEIGRQESSAKTKAYKALDSLRLIIDSLPE